MRRIFLGALSLVFACGLLPLAGCGDDSNQVTQSPEAKKADVGGQEGMREYMQGKSKKPAAPAKGAPGPR